ncbi:hypothetical protein [Clostridium tagluense]|uniref:hypothetical protein n=1 Tax=Clostridium tagluense TaxID=360422 RepID=UPI001CF5AB7A|nr:hypothetical protein [Clostridium tagluense]MCB2300935.1 hypothetical protein [Clostridium tagluense]
MGIEIDVNNSIKNTIKLNEQLKVLHESASSIKISQSFSQSIATSMEMVKSKSNEVQSSFKGIAKGSGVKESIGDQSKYFHKFIEDLKEKKISIKAVLDLPKNDIQKMMGNINIKNNVSTSVNIAISTDTLQKTIDEIKESFEGSTDTISESLNSTKEIINEIKIAFKAMLPPPPPVNTNQHKHFVKLREEVQATQEAIIRYNNQKMENKKAKKTLDVEIARASLEAGIKLTSHSLKEFVSQKYYLTLALKDMAKDKIKSIVSTPRDVVVSMIARTSQAMKKIGESCKKKFSVAISAVDKTKNVFSAVKDKMKLLSSPISFIAKNFVKPALANDKDPSAEDAAKQIERVKKSMNGMKASLGKVFMPVIAGVLKPIANWLEKYQPRIDKFIQGISGKIKIVMSVITPIIGKFFAQLSKTVEKLLPTFTKVFKAIPNIIQGMQPVLEKVFSVIVAVIQRLPPIFNVVINVVKFLGKAWKEMWPAISAILEIAWGIIEPIFSIFKSLAQVIVDIFVAAWPGISKAVQGVWEFIKPFLNLIKDALGGIAKVAGWVADTVAGLLGGGDNSSKVGKSGGSGKSNAFGLARVPYDNYPALLHQGERVLTKQEANSSSGFGGVSIAKLADTIVVREEADIDRISNALVNKLQNVAFNMA